MGCKCTKSRITSVNETTHDANQGNAEEITNHQSKRLYCEAQSGNSESFTGDSLRERSLSPSSNNHKSQKCSHHYYIGQPDTADDLMTSDERRKKSRQPFEFSLTTPYLPNGSPHTYSMSSIDNKTHHQSNRQSYHLFSSKRSTAAEGLYQGENKGDKKARNVSDTSEVATNFTGVSSNVYRSNRSNDEDDETHFNGHSKLAGSPNPSSCSMSSPSSPVDISSGGSHHASVNIRNNHYTQDVERLDPNRSCSAEFISVNSTIVDNQSTHPHQIVGLVEPSTSRVVEVDVEVMASRLAEIAQCSLDDARDALRSCNFHVDEALLCLMENQAGAEAGRDASRFGYLLANGSNAMTPPVEDLSWTNHVRALSRFQRLQQASEVEKFASVYRNLEEIDPHLFSIYGRKMAPFGTQQALEVSSTFPIPRNTSQSSSGHFQHGGSSNNKRSSLNPRLQSPSLLEKFSRYQEMLRLQQSILPADLQHSEAFSEIILESSVVVGGVGQMLMLPWNDSDVDIKNNFWISSYPKIIHALLTHRHSRSRQIREDAKPVAVEDRASLFNVNWMDDEQSSFGVRIARQDSACHTSGLPRFTSCEKRRRSSELACSGESVGRRREPEDKGCLHSHCNYHQQNQAVLSTRLTHYPQYRRNGDRIYGKGKDHPPNRLIRVAPRHQGGREALEGRINQRRVSSSHWGNDESFNTHSNYWSNTPNIDELKDDALIQDVDLRKTISGPDEETSTSSEAVTFDGSARMSSTTMDLAAPQEVWSTGIECYSDLYEHVRVTGEQQRSYQLPTSSGRPDSNCLVMQTQNRTSEMHINRQSDTSYEQSSSATGCCQSQHPSIICRTNSINISPSLLTEDGTVDLHSNIFDRSGLFCEGWSLDDGKWTDLDGFISLSQKQRIKFYAWRRITELEYPHQGSGDGIQPCVIAERPRSSSIRQGFVGDCSFLSSLAVLAEFENAHQIPIVTGIIFPQRQHPSNPNRVIPLINPKGVYACRLFFNGVPRKVLLDDYVPIRKDGKLLAAHTSNRREYWVTLLEKSFVKLMGGSYFMQGSNPGADLYHLTGWIPETIPFRMDIHTGSPDTHRPIITGGVDSINFVLDPKWDIVWMQLYDGLKNGKCVACLGTSEVADAAPSGLDFPEGVSQSSGIVARHAYSVLNFQEINGARLLYVKNPWCCIRWRGQYGPYDEVSWTADLQRKLNYDRSKRVEIDDGCFWINWEDVVKWFSHLYICWNSACFPYQTEIHSKWDRTSYIDSSLLPDDSHLVAFNPQFKLTISNNYLQGEGAVEIWVLLSRHVRERKRDLSQKYLAVHVHTGSERVCCPPPPTKQGIYSNGECTLVKLRVALNNDNCETQSEANSNEGSPSTQQHTLLQDSTSTPLLRSRKFVLVVSQYSQKDEFNFTMKVYSRVPTTLTQLPPLIRPNSGWVPLYREGKWESATAGGCSNDLWAYFKNPQTRLYLPTTADVVIFLECPAEHSVNLRIFKHQTATARLLRSGRAISSGPYRSGCCIIKAHLEGGVYTLVASTFRPGELGDYQICLYAGNFLEPPLPLHNHGIILQPLPHPYCAPPIHEFYSRDIRSSSSARKRMSSLMPGFGDIIRINTVGQELQCINAALRLKIHKIFPLEILPSIVIYRKRDPDERSPEQLSHPATPSPNLIPVARSDLEGGQSEPGRPISSAAQDLYKKQGIVTLSNVLLDPKRSPYYVVVSPVVLRTSTDGATSPSLVPIGSPNCPLRIPPEQTSGDFTLYVLSDLELDINQEI